MFRHHVTATLAAETASLLNAEHAGLNRMDRWQLIERIDQVIDRVQQQIQVSPLLSPDRHHAVDLLIPLRLKRFQVWNSFYPQYNRLIQPAAL